MKAVLQDNRVLILVSILLGAVLLTYLSQIDIVMLLALPAALFLSYHIFKVPFWGLLAVVFLSQLDAAAFLLFQFSPVSAVKAVTALTVLAVVTTHRKGIVDIVLNRCSAVSIFLILLVIATLLSSVFARDSDLALDEIRRLIGVLVLTLLVIVLADTRKKIEGVILAIVMSTLFSAVVLIYDTYTGGSSVFASVNVTDARWQEFYRASGASLHGPTMAASMLLCGTALSLILLVRTPQWRILTMPTAVLGSIAIIFSLTRSASLTNAFLIGWLLWKLRMNRAFPFILAGLIVVGLSLFPLVPAEYWDKLSTLRDFNQDTTLTRRLSYHIVGIQLFWENPLFGIGAGNFPVYYDDFAYRWIPGRDEISKELHNQYLQFAVECGILGFVFYVGLLGTCLKLFGEVKRRAMDVQTRLVGEALEFSFVSLLIQMFFLSSKFNKYLWIYVGLAAALHYVHLKKRREESSSEGHESKVK